MSGLYIDDAAHRHGGGARAWTSRDILERAQRAARPQEARFSVATPSAARCCCATTDPGDEFGGTVRGGFGSDDLIDGFLAVNVPMGDTLKARFTAGRRKQDGYVTRPDGTDLGDTNTYTLTSKFIWKPTDQFEARLLADYSNADEHGSPLVFASINTAATFPRVASADAGCPGFNGNFATLPAVPNIPDDRCANNFQAARPVPEQRHRASEEHAGSVGHLDQPDVRLHARP